MLVACRLAGLSALEAHYAGVRVGAQIRGPCGCAAQPHRSSGLALKIKRLAANSRLAPAAAVKSLAIHHAGVNAIPLTKGAIDV